MDFLTHLCRFMGSEADLDADIKALSLLSEHPELYEEFARLGCVSSLVSLLSHENTDIAIDAIEVIGELIDEDVEADQPQWDALVDALLDADLLDLLHQNIARFDEITESDRAGVYHVLVVLESLSSRTALADLVGKHKSIIGWLISRSNKKESVVSQNKQYAAEVLAILLQSSATSIRRFQELNGVDTCLQALSSYRRRDPAKGTEEEEFVENLFDCLTCSVDDAQIKQTFIDAEGVELCLIMIKEGKMSKPRALRLLDHALGGPDGGACCEKLVEAAGLKPIFGIFMKKQDQQLTEYILGVLASMLRSLPVDSAPRIRVLGKFVEKDYEKIDRLIQVRRDIQSRVGNVDRDISKERQSLSADEQEELTEEWLSRRMDAGLFSLQTTNIILTWLTAEDNGAKEHIIKGLSYGTDGLKAIRSSLQEHLDSIGDAADGIDVDFKDMLATLISFSD